MITTVALEKKPEVPAEPRSFFEPGTPTLIGARRGASPMAVRFVDLNSGSTALPRANDVLAHASARGLAAI